MSRTVHQIKVTLRGTRPPIWRRIAVYSDTTLFELHEILQVTMGWMDSHLHQYRKRETYYGNPNDEFGIRRKNEKKVRLNEVLQKANDRMVYEYDFGDGWEHDLVLEKVEYAQEGMKYPTVLKGKGACPPEDVGGVYGYYDFLEAISDHRHPEHKNMIDWCGEFDPNEFDIEEANSYFHGINKDA
jgi:hypothetical protein